MIKRLITYWFKRSRWIFTGTLPKRLNKSILVVAPHTSRKDFLLFVAIGKLTHFRSRILVNKKYFTFPMSAFLKHNNASAYDPNNTPETTRELVNLFNERKKFSVVMTAERSCEKSDDWDLSFYDAAKKLQIPIVMVALDYKRREVKMHTHFSVSQDKERDLQFIRNFFSVYEGKRPEKGIDRFAEN